MTLDHCRAYTWLKCEGPCENEACSRKGKCWAHVRINDGDVYCQLAPHTPEVDHKAEVSPDFREGVFVTVTWPTPADKRKEFHDGMGVRSDLKDRQRSQG